MAQGKRGAAKEIERLDLQGKAIDLRKQGKSLRAIGDELGISYQTAKRYIKSALAATLSENHQKADVLRALELEKLDWLWEKLEPAVQKGSEAAIREAIKISALRAKLLGLEAPTKIAPTDPSGEKPYFEVKPIEYRDVIPAPLEDRSVPNSDPSGQD